MASGFQFSAMVSLRLHSSSLSEVVNKVRKGLKNISFRIDPIISSSALAKVATLTNGLNKLQVALARATGNVALNLTGNLSSQIGTVTQQLKTLNQVARSRSINLTVGLNSRQITLVSNYTTRLNTLNVVLNQVASSALTASRAVSIFNGALAGSNLAGVLRQLNGVNTAVGQTRSVTSGAAYGFTELGKQSALALRRFGGFVLAAGSVHRVASAFSSALAEAIVFDRELVRLQQVVETNRAGVRGLANEIDRLSVGLGVSSQSLLTTAVTLAQAGLSGRDTKVALESLAKTTLASSFGEIGETTESAIALMAQFGIEAKQLESALGSINAVSAKFAVEASDIGIAISQTGGVFASMSRGVSEGEDALREFIAIFSAVRATSRESAETISSGLRTIFTRISRPETIEQLKKFNVQLLDSENKFIGAGRAVFELQQKLGSLDPRSVGFLEIQELLGGYRQVGKVIPLLQQGALTQQALNEAIRGTGSLSKDALIAQQSFANQIQKTREEFVKLIRDMAQTETFKAIANAIIGATKALISFGSVVKPLLPVIATIGAIKLAKGALDVGRGFSSAFGGTPSGGVNGINAAGGAAVGGVFGPQLPLGIQRGTRAFNRASPLLAAGLAAGIPAVFGESPTTAGLSSGLGGFAGSRFLGLGNKGSVGVGLVAGALAAFEEVQASMERVARTNFDRQIEAASQALDEFIKTGSFDQLGEALKAAGDAAARFAALQERRNSGTTAGLLGSIGGQPNAAQALGSTGFTLAQIKLYAAGLFEDFDGGKSANVAQRELNDAEALGRAAKVDELVALNRDAATIARRSAERKIIGGKRVSDEELLAIGRGSRPAQEAVARVRRRGGSQTEIDEVLRTFAELETAEIKRSKTLRETSAQTAVQLNLVQTRLEKMGDRLRRVAIVQNEFAASLSNLLAQAGGFTGLQEGRNRFAALQTPEAFSQGERQKALGNLQSRLGGRSELLGEALGVVNTADALKDGFADIVAKLQTTNTLELTEGFKGGIRKQFGNNPVVDNFLKALEGETTEGRLPQEILANADSVFNGLGKVVGESTDRLKGFADAIKQADTALDDGFNKLNEVVLASEQNRVAITTKRISQELSLDNQFGRPLSLEQATRAERNQLAALGADGLGVADIESSLLGNRRLAERIQADRESGRVQPQQHLAATQRLGELSLEAERLKLALKTLSETSGELSFLQQRLATIEQTRQSGREAFKAILTADVGELLERRQSVSTLDRFAQNGRLPTVVEDRQNLFAGTETIADPRLRERTEVAIFDSFKRANPKLVEQAQADSRLVGDDLGTAIKRDRANQFLSGSTLRGQTPQELEIVNRQRQIFTEQETAARSLQRLSDVSIPKVFDQLRAQFQETNTLLRQAAGIGGRPNSPNGNGVDLGLVNFGHQAGQLAKALENARIPSRIELAGTHTHELRVNGLEAFAHIKGAVGDMVRDYVDKRLAKELAELTGQPKQFA